MNSKNTHVCTLKWLTKFPEKIMKGNSYLNVFWLISYIIRIHFKVLQASEKGKYNKDNLEKRKLALDLSVTS